MKILFVVNEIPSPPDNGVRIVSHNAMQLMANAGHQLALAVLTMEDDQTEERFSRISTICQSGMSFLHLLPKRSFISILISALVNRRLFFIERYRNSSFSKRLSQLIADFQPDVIHFDIITMTQYLHLAPAGVGTVASINDSYSLTLQNQLRTQCHSGPAKYYRKFQYWQSQRYESSCYARFCIVHLMSQIDAQYLTALNSNIKTCVVPNGVDQELLALGALNQGKTKILFVAKLADDNLKNLRKFLATSWPIVKRECPAATLSIVGKLTTEANQVKAEIEQNVGVEFKGYIADLSDVYRLGGIALVPIDKNCGIINKALEGMAAGLAVVGFSNAFAGITGAKSEINCVAVDDYEQFGKAVVKLLKDEAYRCAIQQQASALIQCNHTWAMRSQAYEKMYSDAFTMANEHQGNPEKLSFQR
jgi:polysaccharide biosynthesis protein PslH